MQYITYPRLCFEKWSKNDKSESLVTAMKEKNENLKNDSFHEPFWVIWSKNNNFGSFKISKTEPHLQSK